MIAVDRTASSNSGAFEDRVLPGRIIVRVVDADDAQRRSIGRALGGRVVDPAHDTPALTVRFVPNVQPVGRLRLIGEDAAVDDSGTFFLLVSQGGSPRLVAFPLGIDAGGTTLTCDASLRHIPHLVSLLNALALRHGVLPLHASAAVVDGLGIAAAGWSKSGKTEALLAMCSAGGQPVADEWCYVEVDSGLAEGIMGPLRLTDAHVRELRELERVAGRLTRLRATVAGSVSRAYAAVSPRSWRSAGMLRPAHRLMPFVEDRAGFDIDPVAVFGTPYGRARIDRLVLLGSWERPDTATRPVEPGEAVDRLVAAHMHHRRTLLSIGHAHRFARPDVPTILDDVEERERQLLQAFVGERQVPMIEHPHPAPIGALRDALMAVARDGR